MLTVDFLVQWNPSLYRPWGPAEVGGGGSLVAVWILKRFLSVFINACRLLSALSSLSQFGRGRLSLVEISFYLLSLLFGLCRLSEFTRRHCHNLAEGGCLLSWFHFTRCRYFLGYVASRNLPWQGLLLGHFFGPAKWPYIFLSKNPWSLIQSPINTANSHISKSETVESLAITPL